MPGKFHPKNPNIRNGVLTELYLFFLRHRWKILSRVFGLLLGCEIRSPIPQRLFLPHPNGIVIGNHVEIADDVALMQQATLGCRAAYADVIKNDGDPVIEQGAYIGPGAKVLGKIRIGAWSIIGANAVVTENVPPHSTVVGFNKILQRTEILPPTEPVYARNLRNHLTIAE